MSLGEEKNNWLSRECTPPKEKENQIIKSCQLEEISYVFRNKQPYCVRVRVSVCV